MSNNYWIILPNAVLLALFIIFLWQKRSLKSFDWLTLIAITLGIFLLGIVIVLFLNSRSNASGLIDAVLIAIPAVMLVLFLLFLTRVITMEKVKSKFHLDERITTINAKSARNALVAVYLSSIIDLMISSDITKEVLLGILAASLVVYLASMVIYYYRGFGE
ncbi:MAG TPA: hypothetical protein VF318_08390 [Dehalococcoidales bacterium]